MPRPLFLLAALALLTACDRPAQPATSAKPKVALVMKSLANEFFATMADGAKKHQAAHAGDYELISGGIKNETDLAEQVGLVEQMVAQGAKAIVIAPADSKALVPALKRAQQAGVPVIFNPSPWRADFPWGRHRIDFAVLNEREAAALLGRIEIESARPRLDDLRIGTLVLTRGARPTQCVAASGTFSVPVQRVKPVDTVGAGDAFAGAFAAALARGLDLRAAIARANCAAALATLKAGAQEALPTEAQVARRIHGG